MDHEIESAFDIKEWTHVLDTNPSKESKYIFKLDKWEKVKAVDYLLGICEIVLSHVDISKIEPKPQPLFEGEWGKLKYVGEVLITADGKQYNQYEHIEIINAFNDKRKLMSEVLCTSNLTDDSSPQEYIDWALSKGYTISWLGWAIDEGYYKSKDSQKTIQTEFDEKEINSMLKIILCLAKTGYKYDKHGSVSEMVDDIDRLEKEYRVTEKTLRKYLRMAEQRI